MENGEYKVGLDTLFRILQVFELSMSSFFEEAAPEADEAGGVDSPDLEHNDEREQLLSDWTELSEDGRREVREFISFKRMQTESRRPSTPLGAQIPQDSASPIASTVKAPHWKPDHGLLATGLTVVKRSPTARPAESVASVEDSERQDGRDVSKTDGGASDVRG